MKTKISFAAFRNLTRWIKPFRRAALGALLIGQAVASVNGQTLSPVDLNGTVRFTNPDSAVRALFGPMNSARIYTTRHIDPPGTYLDAISGYADYYPGPVFSFDFHDTLDASPPGGAPIRYDVSALIGLAGQEYWMGPIITAPAVAGATLPSVTFADCAAVLDIMFKDDLGHPLEVTGGTIEAKVAGTGVRQAYASIVAGPGGTREQFLAVRSGVELQVTVNFTTGTGNAQINFQRQFNLTPACDSIVTVSCARPALTALGRISGEVNMAGMPEVPEIPLYSLGGATPAMTVRAYNGPFGNLRDANLLPSTHGGAYNLPNLVPTTDTQKYTLLGYLNLRSGDRAEFFSSPQLGPVSTELNNPFGDPEINLNPAVSVATGSTVDLGDTFVLQPGFVKGSVTFQGPPLAPGHTSPFQGSSLFRAPRALDTTGHDGVPDSSFDLAHGDSRLIALGRNIRAPGAIYTAAGGAAYASFGGDYSPAANAFVGDYEWVLGGLHGESSIWSPAVTRLIFNTPDGTLPEDTFRGAVSIMDYLAPQLTIVPGHTNNYDVGFCFSKVIVHLHTPEGSLWNPAVSAFGGFYGTDFRDAFRWYNVDAGSYSGTPATDVGAKDATVVIYVPAGDYSLQARAQVQRAAGPAAQVGFRPIPITVGCASTIEVGNCLALSLNPVPPCASSPSVRISGSVTSCTNVTKIVWDQGDNIQHLIGEDVGMNPSFAFDLPVSGPCQDHTFTVTAYDGINPPSSVTLTIPGDHIAPVIHVPTNIVVNCAGSKGAAVTYAASASDNCDPTPTLICAPGSGSWFPLGNTTVQCVAVDRCGNTNRGSFVVTVTTNCPATPCLDIHCPTNIVAYAPCSSNCVPVYFNVTAVDRCGSNPVVVMTDRPSGSCFALGTTWVNTTVYANGYSNQCSFAVTVLREPGCASNPPPCIAIHCPTNLTVYAPCGSNCVPVSFNVWANDPCASNTVFLVTDRASGSCFSLGTTWVNSTGYANGYSNSCSFAVTVLPDPSCQPPGVCTNCNACTNGCSTNLIVNGSFEQFGVPGGYVAVLANDPAIHGWSPILNGVQYYNPMAAPSLVNTGMAANGNYLVDLAPAAGLGGGLKQTFATCPGRTYHVSFALGTSKERGRTGHASLTVTVNGAAHAFNVTTESPIIAWETQKFNFVATSTSATLVFSTIDDPALSFVNLDDVRVGDCCTDSGLKITPSVTVEWECGILQSATEVTGPYTDLPGATSPYTTPATGPQRFFTTRN